MSRKVRKFRDMIPAGFRLSLGAYGLRSGFMKIFRVHPNCPSAWLLSGDGTPKMSLFAHLATISKQGEIHQIFMALP